jgi:hypothetical protein
MNDEWFNLEAYAVWFDRPEQNRLGMGGWNVSFVVDHPFKLPDHYWQIFYGGAAILALLEKKKMPD